MDGSSEKGSIKEKSHVPSLNERKDAADTAITIDPSSDGILAEPSTEEKVTEASESLKAPAEEDGEYPTGIKLVLISAALCLSVFCMALDNTIIATAIPRITDHFGALNDVGWYGSAYLLTTCSFQLIFGKLFTFYSLKWVYMAALFIFELGSLVCGVTPTSIGLIIGRAIAGLGAAGLFSGAILIVAHTVPLHKRPAYTGIIGAMYGIASVAGPLMGGAFTDKLSWRWCFYVNLPIGFMTALFLLFFFTPPKSAKAKVKGLSFRQQAEQFDLLGTLFFLPCIICLLLALTWGGSKYEWGNWRIILLFVVFGVLAISFATVQWWKGELATVPPRVIKQRSIWSSAQFASFTGAAFFVMIYYIPIWFQAIKGVSAVKSGIMNLPMILGLVLLSMFTGALITKIGYYAPFMIAGSVLIVIGAGLMTTFEINTGHAKWIGYQVIFGIGMGCGMQQPLIAVQTALPKEDVPIGTAVVMFSQTLGGALFVSVGQNVFTNQLLKNLQSVVPDLNPAIVLATGATQLKNVIPHQFLSGVLTAYNKALTETFYVSVAMGALSIIGAVFVEWKSVKGVKLTPSAA